jgi:hypothetical protein
VSVIFGNVLVRCLDDFSGHPSNQRVPLYWNLALELWLHPAAKKGFASIMLKLLVAGVATESSNWVSGEKE